jgi:large subunit ribosomal protein L18
MGSLNFREQARLKRKKRIRKKVSGTAERPRLSVFRSAKHIYAQIIDDTAGRTLVAASTVEKSVTDRFSSRASETPEKAEPSKKGAKVALANLVGQILGERAVENGVKQVVFDRNGFLYHGRVKAVSDGARKAGLDF